MVFIVLPTLLPYSKRIIIELFYYIAIPKLLIFLIDFRRQLIAIWQLDVNVL